MTIVELVRAPGGRRGRAVAVLRRARARADRLEPRRGDHPKRCGGGRGGGADRILPLRYLAPLQPLQTAELEPLPAKSVFGGESA